MAASVLLGLAALAVFEIPHGFEEQVGWYLGLLPGGFFAAAFSDLVESVIPRGKSIMYWGLLFCLNFLWYFVISYAAIKVYRFFSEALKNS